MKQALLKTSFPLLFFIVLSPIIVSACSPKAGDPLFLRTFHFNKENLPAGIEIIETRNPRWDIFDVYVKNNNDEPLYFIDNSEFKVYGEDYIKKNYPSELPPKFSPVYKL